MSKFNIVYNEFSQQFITLPLTLKNVSGEGIIVKSIFIENKVNNIIISDNDILFYFDETLSNYDEAETLYTATYDVSHSGYSFVNQKTNKKDKINYVFSLENNNKFNFVAVFNPNISKNVIRKGVFSSEITVNYQKINKNANHQHNFNLVGESSDKVIAKIQNVHYNRINRIFDTRRSQIINLN